ncbi:MAG: rod shape-determining protein MreC [Alphaproteobacteria bacterium]|uniref:Cell shape-determining protein MreC n=1 Tax=Candidatus Nitrobium versatile TaxID=2884831 RepID=A0A953M1R6_9BACT|nr:rod shape-determining protein MreC [Candidatus Nitrobium versatile]
MSKGKKRLIILASLLFLSLAAMSYQRDGKPPSFFEVLSYPYYLLNEVTSEVSTTLSQARRTFEENKRLRRDMTQLLLERQKYREIIEENKRLKELLSLKEQDPRFMVAAEVIARGYDSLLNTVILDKGRRSGIEKGMAVVTTKGLVGKVYAVREDFSDVLLLKDVNFSAAVRLQNSRHEGILSGTGYGYCVLKYIPPEEAVAQGEVVVTSGLDGLFPPGLPVGVVGRVRKEKIEFFQYIEVVPFQSSGKLEEVVILK